MIVPDIRHIIDKASSIHDVPIKCLPLSAQIKNS
jgi:hypothetical protein